MDRDERLDLVRRMFALLTGRLEDAATIAVEGQGARIAPAALATLAGKIQDE